MTGRQLTVFIFSLLTLWLFAACDDNTTVVSPGDGDDGGGGDDTTTIDYSNNHEDPGDYVWDENDVTEITLAGQTVSINGDGASADSTTITIGSAGTYRFVGTLNGGRIVVDTEDEDVVRVILNNADITCGSSAPFFVANADKTVIILTDGSANRLTDADSYVYDEPGEDEPNAALFSKDDLTIYGNGLLTIKGNYNDGIASKDGLIISGSSLAITAEDDGIRGKDYAILKNGSVSIYCGGDGIKSTNDGDATLGFVVLEGTTLNVLCDGDGVSAVTDVAITSGAISIEAGGGSHAVIGDDDSAKGIKSDKRVIIDGGYFALNTADDGVHSNGSIGINDGTFTIATGDDAVHSDGHLVVSGGTITISECYEGLESADSNITITGGDIHINASDDAINVAGGGDKVGPGDSHLQIDGGYVAIVANGDGIDVNGAITMTGGTVIVHGPIMNDNGAIDYNSYFNMTGGILVAAGSSPMAQQPGTSSTQCTVMVNFSSPRAAGTLFHVRKTDATEILTFRPSKNYQSIVFCLPTLAKSTGYNMYLNGSCTGTEVDGLYSGGSYTPGTALTGFTISSVVTKLNR